MTHQMDQKELRFVALILAFTTLIIAASGLFLWFTNTNQSAFKVESSTKKIQKEQLMGTILETTLMKENEKQ